jgi:hypothetical protein
MKLFDNFASLPKSYNKDHYGEYERFLLLKIKENDTTYPFKLYPGPKIMEIWKIHVLETELYQDTFKFVKFVPYTHKMFNEPVEMRKQKYQDTIKLYEKTFKNYLYKPMWPQGSDSENKCSLCKRNFGFECNAYTDEHIFIENEKQHKLTNPDYIECNKNHILCEDCQIGIESLNCPLCDMKRFDPNRICVLTLSGKTLYIRVQLNYKIEIVKKIIQKTENYPPDHQRLIYNGKQLENEQKLSDYKINYNDKLHIVLKLTGC